MHSTTQMNVTCPLCLFQIKNNTTQTILSTENECACKLSHYFGLKIKLKKISKKACASDLIKSQQEEIVSKN